MGYDLRRNHLLHILKNYQLRDFGMAGKGRILGFFTDWHRSPYNSLHYRTVRDSTAYNDLPHSRTSQGSRGTLGSIV